MKRILLLCFMFSTVLAFGAWAQRTVSGKVTDEDGETIPGVNVVLKGTATGTTTDLDGNYRLSVPDEGGVLTFSFIGMATAEVEIGARSVIDIAMDADVKQLTEVVVTAVGIEREKASLGYSVTSVDGEEFVKARETNIANALAGKVAGVQVTSSGGSVGSSTRVVIRGNSSINSNNQPLYVVDGIPISNSNIASVDRFTSVDYGNRIQDINPDDIESMSVLKGPAATALYGQRAANGAIIITTKKGKKNSKTAVTINSSVRFDSPLRLPDYQNEFGQGSSSKIDSAESSNWGPRMRGQTYVNANGFNDTYSPQPDNVADFYGTGKTIINSVALEGGDDKGTFRMSVTKTDQEGFVPNTNMERVNASFNATRQFDNKFYGSFGANYIRSRNEGRPITGYNDDGAVASVVNFMPRNYSIDSLRNYLTPDGDPRLFLGLNQNPYWSMNKNVYTGEIDRFITYAQVGFKPASWVDISWKVGADVYSERRMQKTSPGSNSDPLGAFWTNDLFESNINSDLFVTFNHQITNDLSATLMLGHNVFEQYVESNFNRAQQLVDPNLFIASNAIINAPDDQILDHLRLIGAFFDLNINYKGYLFLNVTGRNDWNSTLPKENQSFFYPSVSASGVLSEIFDIQSSTLSYLKLRANYAEVGNGTDPFQLDFLFSPQTSIFQLFGVDNAYPWGPGIPGFGGPTNIPPLSLIPERTSSWEIGTEMQLFKGKVLLDATYYNSTTSNQIVRIDIPGSTGFLTQTLNAGTVTNRGVEILIEVTPVQVGDFRWTLTGTFARNINKLTELPEPFEFIDINGTRTDPGLRAILGRRLGTIIGSAWRRDDQGNILINPLNGLRLDIDDQEIGNITPDFIAGFNNAFSWKGVTASFLIDWKQGGDIHSQTIQQLRAGGHVVETANRNGEYIDNGVVLLDEDAEGNALLTRPNDIPITYEQFWGQQNDVDEDGVFDGTYVKLREVRLAYSIPSSLLQNTPFGKIEFGVEGRNLAILYSKIPHIDPEVSFYGPINAQGIEAYNLPTSRSYGFNVRLTF
ncbi:MAG: SusC/RagA family TonB-linked outer membrane protein [Cyclobacteriaceae bacterium]